MSILIFSLTQVYIYCGLATFFGSLFGPPQAYCIKLVKVNVKAYTKVYTWFVMPHNYRTFIIVTVLIDNVIVAVVCFVL